MNVGLNHYKLKAAVLLATSLIVPTASAISRVPGTQTYYSVATDPITDVNTSSVLVQEINDTTSDTVFAVRCSNDERPELWAWLSTKHELQPIGDAALGVRPAVMVRLGDDPPMVLASSDLSTVSSSNGDSDPSTIGLSGSVTRRLVSGLTAGKRLVIRVNRAAGGQALTYTFSAAGFAIAWAMVKGCAAGPVATSAAPPTLTLAPVPSGSAPKFTRWYFTTCRDAGSGAVRTGLVAGRAHLCDLVIETVPNGAQAVRAEFRYELEYREAGRSGKLTLDATDVWPPAGGPGTAFRAQGANLVFTLPLNVRVRPERVYTSINVTATVYFSNGTSKKVYEPLPVGPAAP